ncbi:MAG: iron chelate uptake ABC transporter family permease subunit, partial [Alicyclobacillaceae bacterium]|nr:iron chelate uptake ABC transporter family permease subunit [Alicyclobacillaceae bacterium]
SSGAAVGAVGAILFGGQSVLYGVSAVPLLAFCGGMAGLAAVFWLGALGGDRMRNEILILAGVVVQTFLGAILTLLMFVWNERLPNVLLWLMGSLSNRDPRLIWGVLPYLIIGFVLFMVWARDLNVLTLGEEEAAYLGVEVDRVKRRVLVTASLVTAAAVSVSGIIGFVGLVVPHVVRMLVGPDHRILVPLAALGGGVFLLWADNVARMAISGQEVPIGVVTAFLGAPFFAYLLRRAARR